MIREGATMILVWALGAIAVILSVACAFFSFWWVVSL